MLVVGALSGVWLVAGLGMVVGAAGMFWQMAQDNKGKLPHPSDMDGESRRLLRPIREGQEALDRLAVHEGSAPEVRVIAQEAAADARLLMEKAVALIERRKDLKRILTLRRRAKLDLSRLEGQIEEAEPHERESLEKLANARRETIAHYDKAHGMIDEIEDRLADARIAVEDLRARLEIKAAMDELAPHEAEDELSPLVHRLQSLRASFEEADQTLNVSS